MTKKQVAILILFFLLVAIVSNIVGYFLGLPTNDIVDDVLDAFYMPTAAYFVLKLVNHES